ncbi:MAG: acetate--CoA ligase [Myxococcales bacterium]|nr:acetate--CoA ligase [Myxococcales bacterium]
MTEIESHLHELRTFPPPPSFAAKARVDAASGAALRELAATDLNKYWRSVAQHLYWERVPTQIATYTPGAFHDATWFADGTTNLAYNCLDRHIAAGLGGKRALIWEGEPGDSREFTYDQLFAEVAKASNALVALGVTRNDAVAIYMPQVPEAMIAMLACTRLGVMYTVVFGGFSSTALGDRMVDCDAKFVITADGGYRRGAALDLKSAVDAAVADLDVKHVLVVKRTGAACNMKAGRDVWWHDVVGAASAEHKPVWLPSEHPLFTLYTSGSTGKPKGLVHTTGGYMVAAYQSTKLVFDMRDDDIYWCTADIGWITGHTYVTYGPLLNAATVFIYEGGPMHPTPARFWQMIEKWKVSIFYTAPTAIRAFMRTGVDHVKAHSLASLRLLGSVGEPINPEAWMWYHEHIGGGRCPIVDTWWQTETGSIMISPLPGEIATKPGSATKPLPGIAAVVAHKDGTLAAPNEGGYLAVTAPWPSMARTIRGDHQRFIDTYFKDIPGMYFAGDGARQDADGYLWVLGRVDDVLNVSGHRLSTMEVESAVVSHMSVAEAAVVGRPDELKGQGIVVFVTPKQGVVADDALATAIRAKVVAEIGALARPDEIRFTESLPKTRSGKIMRRLLREIASGKGVAGDVTTLEDQASLERLAQSYQHED